MRYGLASDVGGGTSLLAVPHDAGGLLRGARRAQTKPGLSLSPAAALVAAHGLAPRQALGLGGCRRQSARQAARADFVVLDPACTPLLQRRTSRRPHASTNCCSRLIVLGDDRLVQRTVIAGGPVKPADASAASAAYNPHPDLTRHGEPPA
jgi:guanine deaminase